MAKKRYPKRGRPARSSTASDKVLVIPCTAEERARAKVVAGLRTFAAFARLRMPEIFG